MITRYALFEGEVHPGQTGAFRAAVLAEILPVWRRFPGALAVHVTFADDRDEAQVEQIGHGHEARPRPFAARRYVKPIHHEVNRAAPTARPRMLTFRSGKRSR